MYIVSILKRKKKGLKGVILLVVEKTVERLNYEVNKSIVLDFNVFLRH